MQCDRFTDLTGKATHVTIGQWYLNTAFPTQSPNLTEAFLFKFARTDHSRPTRVKPLATPTLANGNFAATGRVNSGLWSLCAESDRIPGLDRLPGRSALGDGAAGSGCRRGDHSTLPRKVLSGASGGTTGRSPRPPLEAWRERSQVVSGLDNRAIRKRIPIRRVLDLLGYKPVFQRSPQWRGPCPMCGAGRAQDPGFSVHVSRNLFRCFRCGRSGNQLDLLWVIGYRFTSAASPCIRPPSISAIDLASRLSHLQIRNTKPPLILPPITQPSAQPNRETGSRSNRDRH